MAGLAAIHSVGSSLATWLRNRYPVPLVTDHPCSFRLLSSSELAQLDETPGEATCALYLHRIAHDPVARHLRTPGMRADAQPSLALTLHYLVTVIASGALAEHLIAAWVARELHEHPLLDASVLSSDAGWANDEVVQILPDPLEPETLARIWESFRHTHRLTLPYVARTVRIDPSVAPVGAPVVAIRTALGPVDAVRNLEVVP
jgi:hypothetical protein